MIVKVQIYETKGKGQPMTDRVTIYRLAIEAAGMLERAHGVGTAAVARALLDWCDKARPGLRREADRAPGMVVVYVAHPLGRGEDREANRRAAAEWCGWISETFHVAISADWIVLSGVWDESKREIGLATDMEMVSRADEVWQVGPRVSPGMEAEAELARSLGKPVLDFTGLTRDEILMRRREA